MSPTESPGGSKVHKNYLDLTPLGLLIYEHLSRRGWSQKELSRRAGLSTATVSTVMYGTKAVTSHTIDAIAAALELDTNELRRLAGLPPVRTAEMKYDDHIEAAAYRLAQLPEQQRETILRQLEHLLGRAEDERRLAGGGPLPWQIIRW